MALDWSGTWREVRCRFNARVTGGVNGHAGGGVHTLSFSSSIMLFVTAAGVDDCEIGGDKCVGEYLCNGGVVHLANDTVISTPLVFIGWCFTASLTKAVVCFVRSGSSVDIDRHLFADQT